MNTLTYFYRVTSPVYVKVYVHSSTLCSLDPCRLLCVNPRLSGQLDVVWGKSPFLKVSLSVPSTVTLSVTVGQSLPGFAWWMWAGIQLKLVNSVCILLLSLY